MLQYAASLWEGKEKTTLLGVIKRSSRLTQAFLWLKQTIKGGEVSLSLGLSCVHRACTSFSVAESQDEEGGRGAWRL